MATAMAIGSINFIVICLDCRNGLDSWKMLGAHAL